MNHSGNRRIPMSWVFEGGCIRCTSHKPSNEGYAQIKRGGERIKIANEIAHRKYWRDNASLMPSIFCARHTCDNKWCINPDHVIYGTWADNNRDRASRGRSAKSVPSRRKISVLQAEEIRNRWSLKLKSGRDKLNGVMAIAKDYGVDPNVVYNIVSGRTHNAD